MPRLTARSWISVLPLVVISVGLTGCAVAPGPACPPACVSPSATPPVTPSAEPRPEGRPTPAPSPIDPEAVVGAVRGAAPSATVGAVVFDRVTGKHLLSTRADRQFRSASLVKLLIAIDALARGAGPAERDRLHRMLSHSDDPIASALWVRGGRSEIVTRTRAAIGLTGTEPPENPGQWGEVKLTPDDVVRIYQYVLNTLPAADRDFVVNALATAPRRAADGFDQHFGIPSALPGPWAIKQGWGNNRATRVVHSTGLVGENCRYIVVLLTEHPLGTPTGTAAESVTAGAGTLTTQVTQAGAPKDRLTAP